ncbi:MAG TPA: guanine deaminase, partial [Zoogloea sp.]|nr:guanine deaminase [Zoogloea sp.]
MSDTHVLVRGQILHYLNDPGPADDPAAWEFFDDGALWITNGHIRAAGPWAAIRANMPPAIRDAATFHDHRGKLVLPGLVDTHIHYPQAGVIGS